MPLPQVVFNKDISAEARTQALSRLERWADSEGVTAVKKQVMLTVIKYAKKNLVNLGILNLNFTDLNRFSICNAIFTHADLPDLLFLQHVINQMMTIKDETSDLKKAVLPMALNYKRPLMLPLVRQMEKASLGFAILALFLREPLLIVVAVAGVFASGLTAEARVERVLNDRLAQPLNQGPAPRLNDGFDDGLNALANLADRGLVATIGFFNRLLQNEAPGNRVLNEANNRYQPNL